VLCGGGGGVADGIAACSRMRPFAPGLVAASSSAETPPSENPAWPWPASGPPWGNAPQRTALGR